ncbi:hypothetical protein CCUS01_05459 [Colletotrichum cuscutae]|uniref:Uncharacterized protein n=1 Tax=Colletotrichum cuscutae TaxID=1209917 RepID=A0AAI9V7I3_9PEZI|nr:hypothetical protein CCUS01_05459 [Colletotrichum cuscutae]
MVNINGSFHSSSRTISSTCDEPFCFAFQEAKTLQHLELHEAVLSTINAFPPILQYVSHRFSIPSRQSGDSTFLTGLHLVAYVSLGREQVFGGPSNLLGIMKIQEVTAAGELFVTGKICALELAGIYRYDYTLHMLCIFGVGADVDAKHERVSRCFLYLCTFTPFPCLGWIWFNSLLKPRTSMTSIFILADMLKAAHTNDDLKPWWDPAVVNLIYRGVGHAQGYNFTFQSLVHKLLKNLNRFVTLQFDLGVRPTAQGPITAPTSDYRGLPNLRLEPPFYTYAEIHIVQLISSQNPKGRLPQSGIGSGTLYSFLFGFTSRIVVQPDAQILDALNIWPGLYDGAGLFGFECGKNADYAAISDSTETNILLGKTCRVLFSYSILPSSLRRYSNTTKPHKIPPLMYARPRLGRPAFSSLDIKIKIRQAKRLHNGFGNGATSMISSFAKSSEVTDIYKIYDRYARAHNAHMAYQAVVPYCIWYPDVATEETYRKLSCAVAGYGELYNELDLLPDVSIAEEARDNGKLDIFEHIMSQSVRYAVINDYQRSVDLQNPRPGAYLNGDTAVRSSLELHRPGIPT